MMRFLYGVCATVVATACGVSDGSLSLLSHAQRIPSSRLALSWRYPVSGGYRNPTSPVCFGNKAFVAIDDVGKDRPADRILGSHLVTLDLRTGTLLDDWTQPRENRMVPAVATELGLVCYIEEASAGARNEASRLRHYVGLVDVPRRRIIWRNARSGGGMGDPVIHQRMWLLYSGGDAEPVYAVELATGKVLGSNGLKSYWPFTVAGDRLYLPMEAGPSKVVLQAYQLPNMRKLWQRPQIGYVAATGNGALIAPSEAHDKLDVDCLDRDGRPKWRFRTFANAAGWPMVAWSPGRVFLSTSKGILAVSEHSGSRIWSQPRVSGSMAATAGSLYVWNQHGLWVLSMQTGNVLRHMRAVAGIDLGAEANGQTAPIIVDRLVILATPRHLIALDSAGPGNRTR